MNFFLKEGSFALPAPVWLLKVFHLIVLGGHVFAVQLLLGGLLIALILRIGGEEKTVRGFQRFVVARGIARRLPGVMMAAVGFGLPSLLFVQVLCRELWFPSGVLMAVSILSTAVLMGGSFLLLKQFGIRLGKSFLVWWLGLGAWIGIVAIARIFLAHACFMLHPEVWRPLYVASQAGIEWPPYDPTMTPRWWFFFVGSLTLSGLWLIELSSRYTFRDATRQYMTRLGGLLASVCGLFQIATARWLIHVQPRGVQEMLAWSGLYHAAAIVWFLSMSAIVLMGVWCSWSQPLSPLPGLAAMFLGAVEVFSAVLYREGIREATVALKGLDLWAREVSMNGGVVLGFLGVWLAGIGGMIWLIHLMKRGIPESEEKGIEEAS